MAQLQVNAGLSYQAKPRAMATTNWDRIMIQKKDIFQKILDHQKELEQLGVKSLYLFGSVARDEATSESDVDLLVDVERPAGFFKFSQLERYLEQSLGYSVDLGTEQALREHCRKTITEDMIRVF